MIKNKLIYQARNVNLDMINQITFGHGVVI